jgi:hypothetical protein
MALGKLGKLLVGVIIFFTFGLLVLGGIWYFWQAPAVWVWSSPGAKAGVSFDRTVMNQLYPFDSSFYNQKIIFVISPSFKDEAYEAQYGDGLPLYSLEPGTGQKIIIYKIYVNQQIIKNYTSDQRDKLLSAFLIRELVWKAGLTSDEVIKIMGSINNGTAIPFKLNL